MTTKDTTLSITLTLTCKPELAASPDLLDLVAGRAYVIEGVSNCTASLSPQPSGVPPTTDIYDKVHTFNSFYGLPTPSVPTPVTVERLSQFHRMLADELTEVDDVVYEGTDLERMTAHSDWLGDIIVYCLSEMLRHGLPAKEILSIIMASNMSKYGPDGKPLIIDGKVQKGPKYWKPEPMISRLLAASARQGFVPPDGC